MDFILSNLFPFLLACFGIFLIISIIFLSSDNYEIKIAIVKDSYNDETTLHSSSGLLVHSYCAKILYEYQINGKSYIGSNIYKGVNKFTSLSPETVDDFLLRYPVGKKIQIMVEKSNPDKSYILFN